MSNSLESQKGADSSGSEPQKKKASSSQPSGPLKADEDLLLVEKAQGGDLDAFEKLFQKYYLPIYQLAFRMVSRVELAEEAAQDTFTKAARALQGFRREASFKSWLWRIAINTSRDILRKRQRSAEVKPFKNEGDNSWTETIPDESPNSGEQLEGHEVAQEILQALDKLPEKQKEAIILTIYEDRTHDEVAKILGVSINTVSWRVHAAKGKLKTILKDFV